MVTTEPKPSHYQRTLSPPEGIHTWLLALELSDQSNQGRFRWRLADDLIDPLTGLWVDTPMTREEMRDLPTWHCDLLGGRFYVLHGDLVSHFLAVRAEIDLNLNANQLWQCDVWGPEPEEVAMLDAVPLTWVADNMKRHPGVRYDYENMPLVNTHWRLCADKELCAWRARDEGTGQLWEVLDYRGLIKGSRFKPRETHIFHQGKQEVIDGVFWFK